MLGIKLFIVHLIDFQFIKLINGFQRLIELIVVQIYLLNNTFYKNGYTKL
jgi:hypothetical protein